MSDTISFLRFPLVVAVLFIHTNITELQIPSQFELSFSDFKIYGVINALFTRILTRPAIPTFFFISGYLFFFKTPIFSKEAYYKSIRKRIRTLFIPYIIGCSAIIAALFIFDLIVADKNQASTSEKSIIGILKSFWNVDDSYLPVNGPLWFVRDLMVVCLSSPIIYFLIKKLDFAFIILLGILWSAKVFENIPGLGLMSFFFFSLGAYFSIYKFDFIKLVEPFLGIAALAFIIISICEVIYGTNDILRCIQNLLGVAVFFVLASKLVEHGYAFPKLIVIPTFFIYIYHNLIHSVIIKTLALIIKPHSDTGIIFLFFLAPCVTISILILICWIMNNYFPSILKVIIGGRI